VKKNGPTSISAIKSRPAVRRSVAAQDDTVDKLCPPASRRLPGGPSAISSDHRSIKRRSEDLRSCFCRPPPTLIITSRETSRIRRVVCLSVCQSATTESLNSAAAFQFGLRQLDTSSRPHGYDPSVCPFDVGNRRGHACRFDPPLTSTDRPRRLLLPSSSRARLSRTGDRCRITMDRPCCGIGNGIMSRLIRYSLKRKRFHTKKGSPHRA